MLNLLPNQKADLIILDIMMPEMDGLEVLDAIKAREPELPVIIFSGHGNIDTAVSAIGRGAMDFIEKPFEAERLLLLVERATETERLRRELASLRVLAERLYRRNPRELKKSGQRGVEAAVSRIFDRHHGWQFEDLQLQRGAQAIQLAFRADFAGDRVLAFVVGLASMVQSAFNDKTEFFVLDDVDPQGLYNAARNVEIAVWKLSNTRNAAGELMLLSNEGSGPVPNLAFERDFGKIIAGLDVLSKVLAGRYNRTVVKVVQSVATAVFLPIR